MKQIWKELLLLLCAALLLLGAGCGRSPDPETEPAPTEPAPHAHVWDKGVCTECGAICEHKWKDGVCTLCGAVCAHEWRDGVCALCGAVCSHEWQDGVCALCGYVCPHEEHDAQSGVCALCGMTAPHRYCAGVCDRCGKTLVFNTHLIDYPVEARTATEEKGTLEHYHLEPGTDEVLPDAHPDVVPDGSRMQDIVVYTPYGYDEDKQYNVLILSPASGHSAHQWLEKPTLVNANLGRIKGCDLLDRLIAAGRIEPLIVVAVEYYQSGSPADVAFFYEWDLRGRVLPFLAENYATYASVDENGALIPAPEHFGYAAYSFGAMIGWQMLPDCTDLFAYWSLASGGYQNDEELAERLDASIGEENPILYLYTGDGTLAAGWMAYRNRVEKLSEDCRCIEDGINLSFVAVDNVEHGYQCCNTGLYNSLQIFFRSRLDPEMLPEANAD